MSKDKMDRTLMGVSPTKDKRRRSHFRKGKSGGVTWCGKGEDLGADLRKDEVARLAFENLAEMMLELSPTIANLIERQARTEFMWQIAEEHNLVPKGMNSLGDLVMERLRNNKELQAIKEISDQSDIVPFEYAQKVREAKRDIRKNDKEILGLIKDLNSDG